MFGAVPPVLRLCPLQCGKALPYRSRFPSFCGYAPLVASYFDQPAAAEPQDRHSHNLVTGIPAGLRVLFDQGLLFRLDQPAPIFSDKGIGDAGPVGSAVLKRLGLNVSQHR